MPRKIMIIRHGERVDLVFNTRCSVEPENDWVKRSFNGENYIPFNLNMPPSLPKRADHTDWKLDPPISQIGNIQAKITGQGLKEVEMIPTQIYSSPAYRCVQTTKNLIVGIGENCPRIKLEPSLAEWVYLTQKIPPFVKDSSLVNLGFNLDTTYIPFFPLDNLNHRESLTAYYDRCEAFINHILKINKSPNEFIVLVAHSSTFEACTRRLLGHSDRDITTFMTLINVPSFLAAILVQEFDTKPFWRLVPPPQTFPIIHRANITYQYQIMTTSAVPRIAPARTTSTS